MTDTDLLGAGDVPAYLVQLGVLPPGTDCDVSALDDGVSADVTAKWNRLLEIEATHPDCEYIGGDGLLRRSSDTEVPR